MNPIGQPTTPSRHLNGLKDASTVGTHTFRKAQAVLREVVNRNGITAVYGQPGNGKTFAVDHFLNHDPAMAHRAWHWLDMPPTPAIKEVTQRLLTGIGVDFDRRDTQYQLTDDLIPALEGRVVVLDEAQNLTAPGLQQVRYLHDRGNGSWSLVLVGSTVDRTLSGAAELSSRVSGWVKFEHMGQQALLGAVMDWHPVMRQLDRSLLLDIDESYAHGNWRQWGQFLAALLSVLDRQPPGTPPTRQHAAAAMAVVQRTC